MGSNMPGHTLLSTSVTPKLSKTSKIRVFLNVSAMYLIKTKKHKKKHESNVREPTESITGGRCGGVGGTPHISSND